MFETMTRKEELQSIYWEMYKEAHGFRPRHIRLDLCTEAEIEQDLDRLQIIIDENAAINARREAGAAHDFEMRVQSLLSMGALDRAMALRWIHEAEETRGDDDYLAYTLGLAYCYFAVDKVAV
jgi:hypothetical protein